MEVGSIYRFLSNLGYSHPLHPVITHLTIGLVMAALIFHLISLIPYYGKYAQTARHCGTLAFLAIFPTVISGLMDWSHYYGAGWIFPIQMKIILAGLLGVLLLLSVLVSLGRSGRSGLLLLIYTLCFFTVVGLGYFGGELVFGKADGKAAHGHVHNENKAARGLKTLPVSFADVQAIFQNHCTDCHAGARPPKGLSLTSYENVMKGGDNGPVAIPEKPGQSELIRRVKGISTPRMPLGATALSAGDIETLEKWILIGAPGPGG